MSKRLVAIFAASMITAVLAAGCGGSGSTKTDFIAKANAICHSASTKTAPLARQLITAAASLSSSSGRGAADHLTSALRQLDSTATNTLTKLHSLKLPSADHTEIERFLTAFASANDGLSRAARAAEAGQPEQALSELKSLLSDAQRMARTAKASGLTVCENALGAIP
jgi:hypothetical protein